jgi:hypothetical protein
VRCKQRVRKFLRLELLQLSSRDSFEARSWGVVRGDAAKRCGRARVGVGDPRGVGNTGRGAALSFPRRGLTVGGVRCAMNSSAALVVLALLVILGIFPGLLIAGLLRVRKPGSDERAGLMVAAGLVGTVAEIVGIMKLLDELSSGFTKGRLMRIQGRSKIASATMRMDWSAPVGPIDASALSPREKLVVGAGWLRTAQLEHASVAAFSELSLRLLALGAPSDLLERTHRAALDEVQHARMSFAAAATYLGTHAGPAPFPELREQRRYGNDKSELERLARGSLIDGVLGEGLASAMAAEASQSVSDPSIRAILQILARDEAEHAELGWRTVEWCVEAGDEAVRQALARAAKDLDERNEDGLPSLEGVSMDVLAAHGMLPGARITALRDAVIEETRARVTALLDRTKASSAAA